MTPDPVRAEAYDELLAACDQALAAGGPLPPVADGPGSMARDLDCLRRLHRWKATRPAAGAVSEVGRFHLRRELGRGGFGVVYLAFDPRLGRDVALKVPRPDVLASADLRGRFHREARAAAGLDHPNVVPVFEAGEAGPTCYIASAYCPGPTLREWLRGRAGPVPVADAAAVVSALADGVAHAHARGVVHRDLKPANVLLQPTASRPGDDTPLPDRLASGGPAGDFTPRITDFGLAKLAGPAVEMTHTGAALGTPSYMAPEQAEGRREIGPAADVYALGAILYECLTGRPPFVGESDLDTLRQAGSQDPVPPSRLRLRLPRDLETVCLKCLEKDPKQRYPTAAELSADLQRFQAGEPVLARRVGLLERVWRRARRRPVVAGLLAAIVALAVGGAAAVTVLWRQAAVALASEQTARREEAAQRERTEAELAARLTLLARIEWEAVRIDRAAAHLRDCPDAHRGREWRYLDRMCRAQVRSIPHRIEDFPKVAYSPDGRFVAVATAGTDRRLTAWDPQTGAELFAPAGLPLYSAVTQIGVVPESHRLVIVGLTPTHATPKKTYRPHFMVWDAEAGRPVHTAWLDSASNTVSTSAAGLLRAEVVGPTIRVKHLLSDEVVEFRHGHQTVARLVLDTGGLFLLSEGQDGRGRVWEAATGRPVHAAAPLPPPGFSKLNSDVLGPDGRLLVRLVGRHGKTVTELTVWDLEHGREVATFDAPYQTVGPVRFSPDGRRLAAVDGPVVRVWDLATGEQTHVLRGHAARVHDIAFGPDGRRLVSVGKDQTVRVWDVAPYDDGP